MHTTGDDNAREALIALGTHPIIVGEGIFPGEDTGGSTHDEIPTSLPDTGLAMVRRQGRQDGFYGDSPQPPHVGRQTYLTAWFAGREARALRDAE